MTRRPVTRTRVALWCLDVFAGLLIAAVVASALAPASIALQVTVYLFLGAFAAAALAVLL